MKKPVGDRDLPVTKRLLDLKIQEVKSEMTSLRLEMRAGFKKVDARFSGVDSDISNLKADVAEIKADLADVKVQISSMQTQMTRMMVILEEQNDRNRAALDGYSIVYERFNDTDDRLNYLE